MPEKKLTPEQVKQLNANAAKMDEQGYSLDEITTMASEYFDKFAREEADNGNFTEGSGEQQEQPTEPLKKPIVDEVNLNPFQEALNKRINEMGGPVDIPEEEQLESLDIIKKKNKELALSTDPQQK